MWPASKNGSPGELGISRRVSQWEVQYISVSKSRRLVADKFLQILLRDALCRSCFFSPLQGFRLVLQIRADVQECWIRCQVRIAWLYLLFIAGSQIFVIAAITVA